MDQDQIRQKQIAFILLGGFGMTVFSVVVLYLLARFAHISNPYLIYALMFLAEFGYYCLCMALYRNFVSRVMWFNQGFGVLIFLTLFKIVTSSIILFFLLPRFGIFVSNILGLMGMFARGFLIELPLLALAAKIFETDIFQKHDQEKDSRVIDNQLKG